MFINNLALEWVGSMNDEGKLQAEHHKTNSEKFVPKKLHNATALSHFNLKKSQSWWAVRTSWRHSKEETCSTYFPKKNSLTCTNHRGRIDKVWKDEVENGGCSSFKASHVWRPDQTRHSPSGELGCLHGEVRRNIFFKNSLSKLSCKCEEDLGSLQPSPLFFFYLFQFVPLINNEFNNVFGYIWAVKFLSVGDPTARKIEPFNICWGLKKFIF